MAGKLRICGRSGVRAAGFLAAAVSLLPAVAGMAVYPPRATATTGAPPVQIQMKNFAFDPPAITVKPGQALVWTNDDVVPHTATADRKTWDSGQMAPGRRYAARLTKPGTYEYTCSNHPFMRAKVVVTE